MFKFSIANNKCMNGKAYPDMDFVVIGMLKHELP